MNKKHKLIFSIIMIFVLCISLSAISAADDDNAKIADSQNDDAKIAESQDYDAISASDVENIEIETADNDVGELSSPAESEILSDAIDTSTATVKVVNGTKNRNGEVLLDFSEICYDIYDTPISSEDTYLTINGETINGEAIEYYHWDYGAWYLFNMPELEEGEYPFTIHYGGNEFFTANDFSGTYYVTKIPLQVEIYPNSVKEGNDGTIEVWIYDDVYYDDFPWLSYSIQDATLIVNGKEYKFDVQASYIDEGKLITIDSLPAGNYEVSFRFAGDDNYMVVEEFVADKQFSVISKDNKANINDIYTSVTNAFIGNNLTITYEIYGKVIGIEMDGKFKIILVDENENEYEYIADVDEDGEGSIDLGWNLTGGTYIFKVQYMGNDYYNPSEVVEDQDGEPMTLTIYDEEHKAPVGFIDSENNHTFEGKNATINIYMPKISDMPLTGTLKLILLDPNENEYEYFVAIDENGRGSIDLGYNLTHGTYDLKAMYLGNDYYKADNFYTWLDCLNIYGGDYKADISSFLNYSFENITKGENATITLDLSPYQLSGTSMAGTMNITLINSDSYEEYYYLNDYVVDDSGKCIAKLGDNLPLGKYCFLLSYSGNDFYNDNEFILEKKVIFQYDDYIDWESEEVYIYVVEKTIDPKAATSLTASNVNINANPNSGYFKVTLKSNGAALAGQNVTITFNGKSYTALTDKNGVASFKLSSGIAKKYPVAISFKGNDKYLGSTANAYVTIKKNKVKFVSPTKKVKKSKAKKAKFKITLKTSNNKVLAKKRVYIKINKKTYKAKTNAKGVATFKLKLPKKKKTYKYKVTFKGDKANNKKTFSKKLKVK